MGRKTSKPFATHLALYASNTLVYRTPSRSNVTLSAVIALWLGISMATSFRLLTYAIRSITGARIANPGSRMRLNLPIRSTIHAVCCGTKRIMVLAGNRGFWKYEGRGPPKLPLLPEKLAGRRVREDVEKERCDWGRRKRAVVVLPARRAALGGGSEGIVRCAKSESSYACACWMPCSLAFGRELRIARWLCLRIAICVPV